MQKRMPSLSLPAFREWTASQQERGCVFRCAASAAHFLIGGMNMVNYEKMYHYLFNAITDVLEKLEELDIGTAKQKLIAAQQETEEMYIDMEE